MNPKEQTAHNNGTAEGAQRERSRLRKIVKELYSIEGKYDGAADRDHIKGYHRALRDVEEKLQ